MVKDLFACAMLGDIMATALKLAVGENPNVMICNTYPIIIAAQEGHLGVVQLLIAAGANVNAQDSDGMTALHHACVQNKIDVVKELLDSGANIDQITLRDGYTALMYACLNGHANIIQLLLERGADTGLCNKYNEKAVDILDRFNRTYLKSLFAKYDAK